MSALHHRKIPVYLISGGFRGLVGPVALELNIPLQNIYANRLKFFLNGGCELVDSSFHSKILSYLMGENMFWMHNFIEKHIFLPQTCYSDFALSCAELPCDHCIMCHLSNFSCGIAITWVALTFVGSIASFELFCLCRGICRIRRRRADLPQRWQRRGRPILEGDNGLLNRGPDWRWCHWPGGLSTCWRLHWWVQRFIHFYMHAFLIQSILGTNSRSC